MFAKIVVIACLVGLARSGALHNTALSQGLGLSGAYPGYAGAAYPGYSGAYPGYSGAYPGSSGAYPGYSGAYPGVNGGVATSYSNFEKYTAPRPYNAAYNGVGSYAGLNGLSYGAGAGLNGLYGGLNGALGSNAAGLPNGGYGYGGYGTYGNKNVW